MTIDHYPGAQPPAFGALIGMDENGQPYVLTGDGVFGPVGELRQEIGRNIPEAVEENRLAALALKSFFDENGRPKIYDEKGNVDPVALAAFENVFGPSVVPKDVGNTDGEQV